MVCLEKLDRSDFEEVYRIMEQSFRQMREEKRKDSKNFWMKKNMSCAVEETREGFWHF